VFARHRASVYLVALAAAALGGCSGAHARYSAHMASGQSYYAAGDFTKASVEFRNALQIEPNDVSARLMIGQVAERLGRPQQAFSLYQSVVDSQPDNLDARTDLARVLLFGGSAQQAMKVIEPALARRPDEPTLLALRAAARSRLKDGSGAVEDAEHALKLAPLNVQAIQVRAGLFKSDGDIAGATTLVSEAIEQLPVSRELHEALVDLYLLGNKPALAEAQMRTLIALAPRQPRYRYLLANHLAQTGRLDAAQKVLEQAVAALPNDDQIKLGLVDFISTQRTRGEGERVLRDFIAGAPKEYDLRLGLGALLEHSGSIKEAMDEYAEVVRLDAKGPKGLIARDRLAEIAIAQGRTRDALDLVQKVLQGNPRDPDALKLRAGMELDRGDPAAAVVDLRAVLRDQPHDLTSRRLLAKAYEVNAEPALAEEALRAGIDLDPADSSLAIDLAQLMLHEQDLDAAVGVLEAAIKNAPRNALLMDALGRADLAKRDYAAASREADALKSLRPDSADGFYLAGLIAEAQAHPNEAQHEFERALAVQPRTLDVLSALAHLQVSRGNLAQAVALVKGAAEREPSGFSFNLLGEIYVLQHNFSGAEDAFTHATQLSPRWWVAWRGLGAARYSASDAAGAIAAYTQAIKVAPNESQPVNELATIYVARGRTDDAIGCYDAWVSRNPRSQVAANNLAMVLVTYRGDQRSLDRARDLTAGFAASSDANLLDTNGWVHFKRGEYDQALAVLEHATQRAPDSREIRYHLAMAELRAGLTERARSDLETAVAGSADFSGVHEAQAALAALQNPRG
jgi:tetratricopeptide (TPR) repeat protein